MGNQSSSDQGIVPFEEALDRAGFGLYSYVLTCFSGFVIISCCCIVYGSTFIIPMSACELETTTAEQGILAAAPIVGLIIGSLVWPHFGDVYGRRIPLMVSLLTSAAVNILASLSVNWIMLMFSQCIASFLASGQFTLILTLLCESVPMIKRKIIVASVTSVFLMTQGIMAVIVMLIPLNFSYYLSDIGVYWSSWRTLLVFYSLPSIISTFWLLKWIKESPKFLYNEGQFTEALDVLATIYKINNRLSSDKYSVTGIVPEFAQINKQYSIKEKILPLFQLPLLKHTIIMICLFVFQQIGAFLTWLPTITNHFFKTFETREASNTNVCKMLNASLHAVPDPNSVPCAMNTTALYIIFAIGIILTAFNATITYVIKRFSHRNIAIYVVTICGACGEYSIMVPNAIGSFLFFIVFLNGFVVMGIYNSILITTFPSSLRAMAVVVTSTAGLVGNVISIQILNIFLINNCEMGFHLFVAIFTLSGIIASLLQDSTAPFIVKYIHSIGQRPLP